jgi:hypothetical protein
MSRANAPDQRAMSIPAGADMAESYKVGDKVRLIGLPDWLLHDLPQDEQSDLLAFVGRKAAVLDIDKFGYVWLGFGTTSASGADANYSGHSFCVPPEFIQPLI